VTRDLAVPGECQIARVPDEDDTCFDATLWRQAIRRIIRLVPAYCVLLTKRELPLITGGIFCFDSQQRVEFVHGSFHNELHFGVRNP